MEAANEIDPEINTADFRRFIEGRARAVQSIAAFLVAHMTFAEGEDAAERTADLATNTLAYHLADDETKPFLIEFFRAIGASIAENTNSDQRQLIRQSPLPPAAVAELRMWLLENQERLQAAVAEDRLLGEVAPFVLRFASSRKITGITKT